MNLLPQFQKETIRSEIKFKFLFVFFCISIFLLFVFIVLEFAMAQYVRVQLPSLKERIEKEKSTEASKAAKSIEDEIRSVNDFLEQMNLIAKDSGPFFTTELRRMGEVMPEGVRLDNVSFISGSISLTGQAERRSQVIELKSNLEKEDFCKKLDAPRTVLKEEDVKFTFNCRR